jgi:hypothetical protein
MSSAKTPPRLNIILRPARISRAGSVILTSGVSPTRTWVAETGIEETTMIHKNWAELIKPSQLEVKPGNEPARQATVIAEPLERGQKVGRRSLDIPVRELLDDDLDELGPEKSSPD